MCVRVKRKQQVQRLKRYRLSLRRNTEDKENGDTERCWGYYCLYNSPLSSVKITLCVSVLGVSNKWNDLNAHAQAFGETRRKKRTETRRVFWGFWNDCLHFFSLPPYSVLSESIECEEGTLRRGGRSGRD